MYILVVEDEAVLRELLAHAVGAETGLEVVMVPSGHRARALLEERGTPLLVIADHVMLDGDGIELGHYCAEHLPAVPFVLLSAVPEEELRSLLGAPHEVLRKPLQLEELSVLLRPWHKSQRNRRA